MKIKNYKLPLNSKGFTDIIDISDKVFSIIRESGIANGSVLVFCPSSTSAISTLEYEPGCIEDLNKTYQKIASDAAEYLHNEKWGDGNGYAHVRSALSKPSFTFPIINGKPILGVWQQIIFIDFDNKPRNRELIVQVMGI